MKTYHSDELGQVTVPGAEEQDGLAIEKAKRDRRNRERRERNQVMRDLGLKRVRGALGGVYWE